MMAKTVRRKEKRGEELEEGEGERERRERGEMRGSRWE